MELKNYEIIKQDIANKVINISTIEGSFIDTLASPMSLELEKAYNELYKVYNNIFLKNLTSNDLDTKADEKGLTRKDGTKAEGTITITVLANTVIPKDTLVSSLTGLIYKTTTEATITTGTVDIPIIAESIGSIYNVPANTITNLPISINGVVSVRNNSEIKGGTDTETDAELLARLLEAYRTQATSGNIAHYKQWAKEIDGISDSKIYPLWNGNGTVLVMPITTNKRSPISSQITEIVNYIETKRPVGATVTVQAPTEVAINISATVKLDINVDLNTVIEEYTTQATKYITDSVYKLYTVDFNRLLSIFYSIKGVQQVTDFKVNNATSNITIADKSIQVLGTINIAQGV